MTDTKIAACLFGTAYGDALGKDTEFKTMAEILRLYPPSGPFDLPVPLARVTDDTQMMLAVGEALIHAELPFERENLAGHLRDSFLKWLHDPESHNNRAPGNTCLAACRNLDRGDTWIEAGSISSKGCGANMRVMPVGLLPVDATTRAGIAQLQSAITHAHPTALAAADITAYAIAALYEGTHPMDLPAQLRDYAHSQRTVYHETWLGELSKRAYNFRDPQSYIAFGWDECLGILDRLEEAMVRQDRETDPCEFTGASWIAEEAFGTGLLCFLLFPDDPVAAIRRGAFSSGDSDSIAAIAGAFAGAYHGMEAWPAEWLERIEYREEILDLAEALS